MKQKNKNDYKYVPSKRNDVEVYVKYTCAGYQEIPAMERMWYVDECKSLKSFFEQWPVDNNIYTLPNGIITNKVKQYARILFTTMRFHFIQGNDDIFLHFLKLLRDIQQILSSK